MGYSLRGLKELDTHPATHPSIFQQICAECPLCQLPLVSQSAVSGEKGTPGILLVGHSRGKFKISGEYCLTFGIFPLYRPCLLIPLFPSTAMLDPGCSLESPEKGGFPGIPVINTSPSNARGAGSIYG